MKYLLIPELKSTSVIETASILRVQAFSNYSRIYFVDKPGTILVSKVLAWVQNKLPPEMFVRIHRSHLVNRMYVKHITGIQTKTVELSNGERVTISRRKNAVLNQTAVE